MISERFFRKTSPIVAV